MGIHHIAAPPQSTKPHRRHLLNPSQWKLVILEFRGVGGNLLYLLHLLLPELSELGGQGLLLLLLLGVMIGELLSILCAGSEGLHIGEHG